MLEPLIAVLNVIFSPLTIFPPIVSLLLIAFAITVLVILINRVFVDRNAMKELKAKMEQMREELINYQKGGDSQKANEMLGKISETNLNYMKHTLKALVISVVVIILIFPWVEAKYKDVTVAKLPFAVPFIGSSLNWFFWYFIASLTIGWVIKKMIGADYG